MFEKEKLIKAQEGDFKTIEEICAATWEPLYRYVYYKVQNREETEDIIQDTYVKAFAYTKKNNSEPDNYIAFLKTISMNVLRDKWRRNKRRGESLNIDSINPSEASVNDSTEVSVQRMIIKDALDQLNAEHRKVIELRILSGYSAAETARLMNKNEANIRVMQHRALKQLAEILDKKKGGSINE